jgi:hypothetical protein
MGLFRRDKADAPDPAPVRPPGDSAPDVDEPVDAVTAAPLGPAERERIDAALAALTQSGVDVDDLASLSAAFDAAIDRDDPSTLPILAVGVGEHLHRHAQFGWAVVTDSFGRDLGLQGSRRALHVVPDSLLTARWMRRERGWLERAVRHLADTSAR